MVLGFAKNEVMQTWKNRAEVVDIDGSLREASKVLLTDKIGVAINFVTPKPAESGSK